MGFSWYEAGLKLAGLRLTSHYSYITVSVELLSKLAPLISMLMQLLRSATIYLNILATVNGPWRPREHPRWRTGVASIFRRRAAHPLWLAVRVCLCFPFFLFLSCTSSHLCSEPPAAEEIISDNWIRAICISPLRERSRHCTAHSDSWGQGQMGALIGPVKAPNTPLWSQLTAIGWLFISNRIAVDPLAEGLQLGFFSSSSPGCTCAVNQGPGKERCSKCVQTLKALQSIRTEAIFHHTSAGIFYFHDWSKILSIQAFPGSCIPWNPLLWILDRTGRHSWT